MEFPEKLTRLLQQRGVSQARLAGLVGVAQSAVSNWTRNQQRIYLDQAFRIARALGVSCDFLADDSLDEPPTEPALSPDDVAVLTAYWASGIEAVDAVRGIMEMATRPHDALHGNPVIDINPRGRIRPVDRPTDPVDGAVPPAPKKAPRTG